MSTPIIYLVLATIFSGTSFYFVKIGAVRLHPLYANFVFTVVMLSVHGAVVWWLVRHKGLSLALSPSNALMVVAGGAVGALYGIFLFLAFQKLDVSRAAPALWVGSLIIVLLLSTFLLKEPFTKSDIAGLILGVSSIILLLR